MNYGITCPECGSKNVELRSSMPGRGGLLGAIRELVDRLGSSMPQPGFPRGQKFIVCKDCGKTASAMFN